MKKFSILAKLLTFSIFMTIITFALIYGVFSMTFGKYNDYVLKKSDELFMERYKKELRSTTENAVTLLKTIYDMKNLKESEKIALARKLVGNMKFGSDGYFFVYESGTGKNLIHGATKKLEGQNLWDLQGSDKKYIIRNLDRVAHEQRIFHKYFWSKPGAEGQYPKLGTAMMVPGSNMWVGTGAYIDNIENEKEALHEDLQSIIFNTNIKIIISFAVIGIIAFLIIVIMARSLVGPIKNMIVSSQEITNGNYDVTIISKTHDEIGQLAEAFNRMTVKLKDYTENLEKKVDDRTHELQNAMELLNKSNEILEGLSQKLSKYLSPQIRESIFTGKQDVVIEARRKKLTVFFSDIRNFTATTDRLETEELTALLNNYLEEMSQIALKHGATIDKFIGDAIMLFFGDPESRGEKEDAVACVSMALEMRERIRELQKIWLDRGVSEPFHIRMGINTGYCTVGNFGSNERMDYTIIGSQVNLASRLESSAEPDQILISHETYSYIKDSIYCKKMEEIKVKGIHYDVQTYQVVDFMERIDRSQTHIEEHVEGFSISADLSLISPGEKREILNKLKDAFNKVKDIK